jgi:hypothetical protein
VAPPPGPGEWDIRFKDTDSAKGWDELCRQVPENALGAWLKMRHAPTPPMDSRRHHRLRRELGTETWQGRELDHWQLEVTGSGRVWYLVDHENKTVWVDYAGPGHPRATD